MAKETIKQVVKETIPREHKEIRKHQKEKKETNFKSGVMYL